MSARLIHQALLQPDDSRDHCPALEWQGGTMTHRELREAALKIAARLAEKGIGRGDRVVICTGKCAEAVQALLGVLVSGAAYVPLDATAPAARLRLMIEDAAPALVILSEAVAAKLSDEPAAAAADDSCLVIKTADGTGLDEWCADAKPTRPPDVSADDTAVILYTSGSTGRPKGVMLSHANVACFVDWAIGHFGLCEEDGFTSLAPLHFDLSTLDLFAPLSLGARVFLVDEKTARFPVSVARIISQNRLGILYAAPTALRLLQESRMFARLPFPSLKLVLFAGEVFPVRALRETMLSLPQARFANLYGPTETNVCTCHVLEGPPAEDAREIPIGLPCEHAEIVICDEHDAPVHDGGVGEICVGGPGVMQGYWRDEEKSARSRFRGRADSFRTGDFGAWNADGTIRFLGRRDHQVKLRGHRIELQEVEKTLMTHPAVRQAVVILYETDGAEAALVAFVQADVVTETLRDYCARHLSVMSVPGTIVQLQELPLTSTGKVDRVALLERLIEDSSFEKASRKG